MVELQFLIRKVDAPALLATTPPPLRHAIIQQFVHRLAETGCDLFLFLLHLFLTFRLDVPLSGLETHGIFRINGKRESRHAILDLVRGYNEEYKVKGKDAAPIDFTPYSVHDVATAFKVLLLRMNQTLLISFSLSLSLSLSHTHTHSLSLSLSRL